MTASPAIQKFLATFGTGNENGEERLAVND
jgi:hypothetical protein